jgi:hypothetical protein
VAEESGLEHEEVVRELWDRRLDEPKQWFLRFQRYYLYRGLGRSVRRAYNAFAQENYPSKAEDMMQSSAGYGVWLKRAQDYDWKIRAEAWDESRNEELHRSVLEASRYLMDNSMKAAEALVKALESARLQVVAANSILDRVGLPSVSKQELLNANLSVSADDLSKMQDAVKAWEQATVSKSTEGTQ